MPLQITAAGWHHIRRRASTTCLCRLLFTFYWTYSSYFSVPSSVRLPACCFSCEVSETGVTLGLFCTAPGPVIAGWSSLWCHCTNNTQVQTFIHKFWCLDVSKHAKAKIVIRTSINLPRTKYVWPTFYGETAGYVEEGRQVGVIHPDFNKTFLFSVSVVYLDTAVIWNGWTDT